MHVCNGCMLGESSETVCACCLCVRVKRVYEVEYRTDDLFINKNQTK